MTEPLFQAPSPEYLAELLPQYDIEFFVAQGGMGAVYKGRQIALERDVAIKVLPTEMGKDPQFRESFNAEAKAMARLNHPNLITVFDFGTVEEMPYIVMEFVHGDALHEFAWNHEIKPSQAAAIVKGICDGLTHAHENAIIHRDIKPSNILLTERGEPKIGDFGLAHAVDSETPGLMMGTPGYTAPEVYEDPDMAGPLADLYAVGIILHQLLTGIDPAGSYEPPTQATGNLRLDMIWRKATQVDPAYRYPSVAAMAADLEKCITASVTVPSSSTRTVPALSSSRRPVPVSAGGGGSGGKIFIFGVLIVLCVFAVYHLQNRSQEIKKPVAEASESKVFELSDPKPEPEAITPEFVPLEPVDISDDQDDKLNDVAMLDDSESFVESDPEPENEPEVAAELEPGDPVLRVRAVGLIGDARGKRDEELRKNSKSLLFNFSIEVRSADSEKVKLIESITEGVVGGRVPIVEGVDGMDADLLRTLEAANTKEQSIDAAYRSELTVIRDAYVTRLKNAASEASEEGLEKRLLAQAERATDLDAWIELLSPEPEVFKKKISGGIVGNWDNKSLGEVHRWTAHAGGRMEVIGKEWEGTWEITEDGTLRVMFGGKKPYIYSRDGDGWSGITPYGHATVLSRGEW